MNQALLAWCHKWHLAFPDDIRTAHHFINWAGELALSACITDADFHAVTTCYEHANRRIIT